MTYLLLVSIVFGISVATTNDNTTGLIEETSISYFEGTIVVKDFTHDHAMADLKYARKSGQKEFADELGHLINNWWLAHYKYNRHPAASGMNLDPGPKLSIEEYPTKNPVSDLWGIGVRIDPSDDIYNVKISSLNNGELYTISVWDSLGNDHILVHRSTDNGSNWNVYWNLNLGQDYTVHYPGMRTVNDTIIMWYILNRQTDNMWRTWIRICLPGTVDSCIYSGSPTGGFHTTQFSCLDITDDSPVYSTGEYLYATWIEMYGTDPDSTRVMFARSDELDVSSWELGPLSLYSTTGANIYFSGTQIAYGSNSDMLWLTAWLHPNGYPATYDRSIWGWNSTDYGATWSPEQHITSMTNGKDEYDQNIAGSHINTNWVILFTQIDTNSTIDRDICYCYSMDDTSWTINPLAVQHEEYLSDILVDNSSTAFYSAYRQDGSYFEKIQYQKGAITDPTSWTQPYSIVDPYYNFSGIYGPSVGRNINNGDAVVVWTNCEESAVYSIWFTSESWYGIHDHYLYAQNKNIPYKLMPNPTNDIIKISYLIEKSTITNITVTDVSGRSVKILANEVQTPGFYHKKYNISDLPQGVYYITVKNADQILLYKFILLK